MYQDDGPEVLLRLWKLISHNTVPYETAEYGTLTDIRYIFNI